jgi:hypothetical protein
VLTDVHVPLVNTAL